MAVLDIQAQIVEDCRERADYWRSLGYVAQADFWTQLETNALNVMRGIEATGDPNYCPF